MSRNTTQTAVRPTRARIQWFHNRTQRYALLRSRRINEFDSGLPGPTTLISLLADRPTVR